MGTPEKTKTFPAAATAAPWKEARERAEVIQKHYQAGMPTFLPENTS